MTGDMQANRFMGQALIHARMSNSLYFTIIIIIIKFHLVVVFPLCCYCLELQQSYIGRVFYSVPSHTHNFFPLHIFYGDHLCTIILLISWWNMLFEMLFFDFTNTHGGCGSFGFVTLDRLCKSNNWLLTLCVCSLNDRNDVWCVCVFFFLFVSSRHRKKVLKKQGWAQGMTLTSWQITWF